MTECWLNSGESPLLAGDPLLLRCILRLPSGVEAQYLNATLSSLLNQSFRNVEVVLPPEPWPDGFDLELWRERCRGLRGLFLDGSKKRPCHYQWVVTAGFVFESHDLLGLEWRLRRRLERCC